MEGTVFTSTYENFVDTAIELLKDEDKLEEQTEKGLEIFKKFPMTEFLKEVIE